jgi:very-short-patch-repair endonuclease
MWLGYIKDVLIKDDFHWVALYQELRPRSKRSAATTSIERKLYGWLEDLGEPFVPQYQVDKYRADAFLPHRNLIIEADGDYWHRPGSRASEIQEQRDFYISFVCGYRILRLWESEINQMTATDLYFKLEEMDASRA